LRRFRWVTIVGFAQTYQDEQSSWNRSSKCLDKRCLLLFHLGMLDFEKFSKPFRATVPIRDRQFLYQSKHYRVNHGDGWFVVEIQNNKVKVIEAAVSFEDWHFKRGIHGYTHHNSIIFQNTDVAKKKFSLGMSAPLHFNQSQTFEAIKAIVWEDGQVYWAEPNYSDLKIFEIKDAYEGEIPIVELKGVTPELRVLYLHHALERESFRKLLEEAKKKEELEKIMASVPGRLKLTFDQAGAQMLNYSVSGTRIIVDWEIPGSHYKYNSVIDSNSWMIIEAGYCMSGDDRRHNITSMVKTAQIYNEQHGRVNITRSNGDDNDRWRDEDDEQDW
jgi:hypothetical protein